MESGHIIKTLDDRFSLPLFTIPTHYSTFLFVTQYLPPRVVNSPCKEPPHLVLKEWKCLYKPVQMYQEIRLKNKDKNKQKCKTQWNLFGT